MRKSVSVLLLMAMLFTLAACGRAPAVTDATIAEPAKEELSVLPVEEQKRVIEASRERWAFTDPYESPWFYTFTDLDHNGCLEVIAATTQGTGVFTYVNFWEVRPDGSGIENRWPDHEETDGPEDWPEIVQESLPCYYDAEADRYYYPCEGVTKSGYAYQYYAWHALCLKNGAADWEFLASKTVEWLDGGESEQITCKDAQNAVISQQEYDNAVEKRFAGMERTELKLDWTRVEIPFEGDARKEETGEESLPAGGNLQGNPEEMSPLVEESYQMPGSRRPPVVITKRPTSEAIAVGGRTWFIAHADNDRSLTWQLVSPDGVIFALEDAEAELPGLKLEVLEEDTLAVSEAPLALNGWGIRAWFDGEESYAVTAPAYIYVGDFLHSYSSVMDAYQTAFSSGKNTDGEYMWSHELSELAAYSGGVGYALKDLDKNGIPELIIAPVLPEDADTSRTVFGLYTLENDVPVNIATSSARVRYFVRTDNSILYRGSGGASYTYITVKKLNGSTLEDTESVFTDYDEADSATVFYSQQGASESFPSEKSIRITEDEFYSRWQQMEESIYIPALTTIA